MYKKLTRVLALLLCAALVFVLCGCDSSYYAKAQKLFDAGDYTAAAQAFDALGDYKDSADQANECRYLLAGQAAEIGDLGSAAEAFDALGDYKDSIDQANECRYLLAEQTAEAGDFAGAAEQYDALGDYKDSADQASECRYTLAEQAMDKGIYSLAIELYDQLGDYKDAADRKTEAENAALTAKLIGDWSGMGDATEAMAEAIGEAGAYLTSCPYEMKITFKDYGSYVFTLDFTPSKDAFSVALHDAIEAQLSDNGISVATFEASIGKSLDEYIASSFDVQTLSQTGVGNYTIRDGVVILDPDSANEVEVTPDGDSLLVDFYIYNDVVTLKKS